MFSWDSFNLKSSGERSSADAKTAFYTVSILSSYLQCICLSCLFITVPGTCMRWDFTATFPRSLKEIGSKLWVWPKITVVAWQKLGADSLKLAVVFWSSNPSVIHVHGNYSLLNFFCRILFHSSPFTFCNQPTLLFFHLVLFLTVLGFQFDIQNLVDFFYMTNLNSNQH